MRYLQVLLAALGLAAVIGCQSRRRDACLSQVQSMSGGVRFDLPDSVGIIRLPPGSVSEPLGSNPDGRKFILEDSTVIEIWVTPEPAAGLAASGSTGAGAIQSCDTRVGRFVATVTRAALAGPSGDSVFVGLLNITLDQEHALNIAVTTSTRQSRDGVLEEVPTFLELR